MRLLCRKEAALLQDGGGRWEKVLWRTRRSRGGLVSPAPAQGLEPAALGPASFRWVCGSKERGAALPAGGERCVPLGTGRSPQPGDLDPHSWQCWVLLLRSASLGLPNAN